MQTIFRFVKYIFWLLFFVLSVFIIWLNIRLYTDDFTKEEKQKDITLQLNFLSTQLKENNMADKMQNIFPEGFIFSNVLYGLAWCELGISTTDNERKAKALHEALYAFDQINTKAAKSIFSANLTPPHGIFYMGWNNYLLSKIFKLNPNFENAELYKKQFQHQTELMIKILNNSKLTYLQSYTSQAWPADMCVAMASISNYNQLFKANYDTIIANWIAQVKAKVDPKTKLIPHQVSPDNGETLEGARGSSISLMLKFIAEIDSNFALEQYTHYKTHFVTTTFGLPAISEYPKGAIGWGDIDSGPVILGVGFSGTIVSIGTFAALGANDLADRQYRTIHTFGFGYTTANKKEYAFGMIPIADAFIAWGRSLGLNQVEKIPYPSKFWRWKFHLISFSVVAFIWFLFYAKTITQKIIAMKRPKS